MQATCWFTNYLSNQAVISMIFYREKLKMAQSCIREDAHLVKGRNTTDLRTVLHKKNDGFSITGFCEDQWNNYST